MRFSTDRHTAGTGCAASGRSAAHRSGAVRTGARGAATVFLTAATLFAVSPAAFAEPVEDSPGRLTEVPDLGAAPLFGGEYPPVAAVRSALFPERPSAAAAAPQAPPAEPPARGPVRPEAEDTARPHAENAVRPRLEGAAQPGAEVLEPPGGADTGLLEVEEPEEEYDGLPPETIEKAIAAAESKKGKPYRWGGTGPNAFDCSGLVQWAYGKAGVKLPRVTHEQWKAGKQITFREAQRGDLLFWRHDPKRPNYISHVGIYLGEGQMIDAPRTGDVVRTRDVVKKNLAGAVRLYE